MTDAEGCRHNLCRIHATLKATPAEARGRAQCGHQTVANVCKGSNSEVAARSRHFCLAPESGYRALQSAGPFRANSCGVGPSACVEK